MEKQLKEIIRSVIREQFISELSKNDVHVKEIMKFYDKGTYSTKKAVSIFVSGKPNASRNQILDDLGDMGYNDAWEVMDHFKLELEGVNEADEIPGGLASGKTMKDFVQKYNSNEYYDNSQMAEKIKEKIQQGVKIEMEHTTDPKVAFEIAKDHIWEDLNYYDKLKKVEEYVDKKGVEHVAAALPQTEEEPVTEGSILNEKQFKGLDGIPSNTSLEKINKDQKLKIIKAPGNIIDFIVPKGVSRNFWQVIGNGKVKKNSAGEHYLEGKVINSPMFKSLDDLINGVNWKSMEQRRRFNESVTECKTCKSK